MQHLTSERKAALCFADAKLSHVADYIAPVYVGTRLVAWVMRVRRVGKPALWFCRDYRQENLKRICVVRAA